METTACTYNHYTALSVIWHFVFVYLFWGVCVCVSESSGPNLRLVKIGGDVIGRTLFIHKPKWESFLRHVKGMATTHKLTAQCSHSNTVSWLIKILLLSNPHEVPWFLIVLFDLSDESSGH